MEYQDWAKELELHTFRVGQLIGRHTDWEINEEDPDTCESEALRRLVDNERGNVVRALLAGFDESLNNPARLFISLWRSKDDPNEYEDDPDFETDGDIVNRPTADKLAAWEWLVQRCP